MTGRAPMPLLVFGAAACTLAFATDQPLILAAVAAGAVALHFAARRRRRMYLVAGLIVGLGVMLLNPLVQANGDLILFELPGHPDHRPAGHPRGGRGGSGARPSGVRRDRARRRPAGAHRPRPAACGRESPACPIRRSRRRSPPGCSRRWSATPWRSRRPRGCAACRSPPGAGPPGRRTGRRARDATRGLGTRAVARRRGGDGRARIRRRAAHPDGRAADAPGPNGRCSRSPSRSASWRRL